MIWAKNYTNVFKLFDKQKPQFHRLCCGNGSILASKGDLSAAGTLVLFLFHSTQLLHRKVIIFVGKEAGKTFASNGTVY